MAVVAVSNGEESTAIKATSTGKGSDAIHAIGEDVGIRARGTGWHGIASISDSTVGGVGVLGEGWGTGVGVRGVAKNGHGVHGVSQSAAGIGVLGEATNTGVAGVATTGSGVKGVSKDGTGVEALSTNGEALHAGTDSPTMAAVAAYNANPAGTGAAVYAKKVGNKGHAGFFEGNVWVSGQLSVGVDIVLPNADCAEDFDVVDPDAAEAGTVMVLDCDGALRVSTEAYDRHVAGIISGAGDYKPGIVLDKQHSQTGRKPIALIGKVFCKVDANYGPIQVGDLLTTSPSAGHAMKASDAMRAMGAVVGKALRALDNGRATIPVLVALQ
ncbi:MAG: hypothetical protein JNN08_04365 [Bryobacterales bacterium]|nr:hypothetical protein [Bryobacterales bacterium]